MLPLRTIMISMSHRTKRRIPARITTPMMTEIVPWIGLTRIIPAA